MMTLLVTGLLVVLVGYGGIVEASDTNDGGCTGMSCQNQIYIVAGSLGGVLLLLLLLVLLNTVNISKLYKVRKRPPKENEGFTNLGFTEGVNNPRAANGDDLAERGFVQYSGRENTYQVSSPHRGDLNPGRPVDVPGRGDDDYSHRSPRKPAGRPGDKPPHAPLSRYSSNNNGEADIPLENMETSRYAGRGLPRVLPPPAAQRSYDKPDYDERPRSSKQTSDRNYDRGYDRSYDRSRSYDKSSYGMW